MSSQDEEGEVWTEEEVIEFGLAGEEEFCGDLETVDANSEFASDAQMMATQSFDEVSEIMPEMPADSSITKSGRVSDK